MPDNRNVGQTLAKSAPAGGSGIVTLSVDADGTIESLKLRIYRGAENTLHLRPVRKTNGSEIALLDYAGKTFVDGDDDVWQWDVSVPIQKGDEIGIRYDNQDPNNPHNFRATVDVDHRGGLRSVLARAKSAIPGVTA
jgi:hypothetical protein